jgi:hypothetical protein
VIQKARSGRATHVERIAIGATIDPVLLRAAVDGYEAPHKQERLGFLFGRVVDGTAIVHRAVIYRGGTRTRVCATVDPDRYARRVEELRRKLGLRYLGGFHTHNEIAGRFSSEASREDRRPISEQFPPLVELIVAIWASRSPARPATRYLTGKIDDYRYRLAAYAYGSKFRLIPVVRRR